MSLLGFDTTGTATINGLTDINANSVYGDELFYDSSTTAVNVKTAIDGISIDVTVLEGQMVTANSNISTLQGQMTTANSNISTLQGEMNTAQSEINTLQSEMNTAQSAINTLQSDMTTVEGVAASGLALAIIADAAVVALAVTVTAQGGSIATLQGQMATAIIDIDAAETNIGALQTKTQHQSATYALTSFATLVDVGGVRLNTVSASSFDYGLSSLAAITSSGGTSSLNALITPSVEPLTITSNLQIGNTQTSGILNVASLAARSGAINLNTGATSTAPINISSGTNTNAPITIGSLTSTTQVMTVNAETTFKNPEFTILKSKNALENQNINFYDAGDVFYMNWMASNNVLATQTRDAGIIVSAGADGVEDDGAMLITSGEIEVLTTGQCYITANQNIEIEATDAANAIYLQVAATNRLTVSNTQIILNPTTSISHDISGVNKIEINATTSTFTSTGETEINSGVLDINATSAVTIDTPSTITLTSTGKTEINSGLLDINATSAVTIDSTSTIGITGTTNTILGITNINRTGTSATQLGNTTGVINILGSTNTILGTTNINTTGTLNTNIGVAGSATNITGTTTINTTGTRNTSIGGAGTTNTYLGTNNIATTGTASTSIGNATGNLTLNGATNTITGTTNTITGATNINTTGNAETTIGVSGAATGNIIISGQNINFVAYNSVGLEATNAYWVNTGQGNFYYRAYNDNPNIIIGNITTDYASISANATDFTFDSYSKPINMDGSTIVHKIATDTKQTITATEITNTVPSANSGLTYPITTSTQLGYFTSATSTTKFTTALQNLSSLSLPQAGCYLVEGQFQFSTPFTAVSYTTISLSTSTATLDKKRQMTIIQTSAGGYGDRLTSIFNVTATTTVYLVGLAGASLGGTSLQDNYISVTRIA